MKVLKAISLEGAERTLRNCSTNLNDYDISYDFDESLKEVPSSKRDMLNYSTVLMSWARLELEVKSPDWTKIVSSVGMAAALKRMCGHKEEALELLQECLAFAQSRECDPLVLFQQKIRFYDAQRHLNQFESSRVGFEELLDLCSENEEFNYYLDVVLQHLGKLAFDQKEDWTAIKYFKKALKLRIAKQDEALIGSSLRALEQAEKRFRA